MSIPRLRPSGSTLVARRLTSAKMVSTFLAALSAAVLGGWLMGAVVQAQTKAVELPDLDARLAGARDASKMYATKFKTELNEAIKAGGVKGAIDACQGAAPELNASVSETTGFEIGRTALRVRNPENVPDPWETTVLERFVKQLADGGDPKAMEAFDVSVTKEGQKLFRYMRPIMMHESCLACHGGAVAPDIRKEFSRLYPEDKATGFNVGELRGAFTLIQEIE